MRRQRFWWTYLVATIVLAGYGTFSFIYNLNRGKGVSILGLIFMIIGLMMLGLFLGLFIYDYFVTKKNKKIIESKIIEQPVEEVEEIKVEKEEYKEKKVFNKEKYTYKDNEEERSKRNYYSTNRSRYDSDFSSTVYVKKQGYGPILRVEGNRLLDMRSNTYYRIEENVIKQEGSGPVFEINGNRIKLAYGSYIYEMNGNNINRTFGGFFAQINWNFINKYDSSEIYEMSSSLTSNQILVVVALLFGSY